jgi:hypothetical protein
LLSELMRELLPSTEMTATGCSERENDWGVGEERRSAEVIATLISLKTQTLSDFTPAA